MGVRIMFFAGSCFLKKFLGYVDAYEELDSVCYVWEEETCATAYIQYKILLV